MSISITSGKKKNSRKHKKILNSFSRLPCVTCKKIEKVACRKYGSQECGNGLPKILIQCEHHPENLEFIINKSYYYELRNLKNFPMNVNEIKDRWCQFYEEGTIVTLELK